MNLSLVLSPYSCEMGPWKKVELKVLAKVPPSEMLEVIPQRKIKYGDIPSLFLRK